ncbi:hypothetical protein DPMN_112883 [Dreissena polymorpha]|uniref:Uncharacterized protein n=1 Tax=Dreissena polymorpha TaxID=45954 RepID=A0A9D4KGH4_DREPO|nr:hypothetical protein DPMN_112883 [Dreissena polymorpha]
MMDYPPPDKRARTDYSSCLVCQIDNGDKLIQPELNNNPSMEGIQLIDNISRLNKSINDKGHVLRIINSSASD